MIARREKPSNKAKRHPEETADRSCIIARARQLRRDYCPAMTACMAPPTSTSPLRASTTPISSRPIHRSERVSTAFCQPSRRQSDQRSTSHSKNRKKSKAGCNMTKSTAAYPPPVRFNPITGQEEIPIRPSMQQSTDSTTTAFDKSCSSSSSHTAATFDGDQQQWRQRQQTLTSSCSAVSDQDAEFDAKVSAPTQEVQQAESGGGIVGGTLGSAAAGRQSPTATRTTLREAVDDDDDDDDDFEDKVAAELDKLRLEYAMTAEEKKNSIVDNHEEESASDTLQSINTQSDTAAGAGASTHSPIPMRDEAEERRERRQRAMEYGAQLRLQMEQDALAKGGRRLYTKTSKNINVEVAVGVSEEGYKQLHPVHVSASYGEQLRVQDQRTS